MCVWVGGCVCMYVCVYDKRRGEEEGVEVEVPKKKGKGGWKSCFLFLRGRGGEKKKEERRRRPTDRLTDRQIFLLFESVLLLATLTDLCTIPPIDVAHSTYSTQEEVSIPYSFFLLMLWASLFLLLLLWILFLPAFLLVIWLLNCLVSFHVPLCCFLCITS